MFESSCLAGQLAGILVQGDLSYSRQIGDAEAAEFYDPGDVIYRFRKRLGEVFENEF